MNRINAAIEQLSRCANYCVRPISLMFALSLTACGGGNNTPGPTPEMFTGYTTTLAGDGTQAVQDSTDGTGATAQFNYPRGMTTDGFWLYSTESTGDRVRRIHPASGETTILSGDGSNTHQDSTDGTGATAGFIEPGQIVYHGGFLYLTDSSANRIRKVDITTGNTTTLAGDGTAAFQDSTDGTGATAQFSRPAGITTNGTFLYVADTNNNRVRQVNMSTGETTTLAGTGAAKNAESTDGTGATASIRKALSIVIASSRLYVANFTRIFEIDIATGNTVFLAGADKPVAFQDSTDGTGDTARFNIPIGMCTDTFFLYVGDSDNNRVRKVDIATGNTTTLAGDGTPAFQDSTDGTGATAKFNNPRDCAILDNALYIADGGNHRIRQIE